MNRKFDFKEIKVREINKGDLKRVKEFQNYVNSLIEEEAMILLNKKKSEKEERDWLKQELKQTKERVGILLIAEDDNRIVGISGIELKPERHNHVGEFGISIKKEYRGKEVGKKLMAETLKLAKEKFGSKLKIIRLSVFSENKIAQNLYKKFNFKKVAKIPKQIQYKGKLIDEIIMIKEL